MVDWTCKLITDKVSFTDIIIPYHKIMQNGVCKSDVSKYDVYTLFYASQLISFCGV